MSVFLIKLSLTPLLIILTTLVARRWGPLIGGCLTALPLSGGPITFFLAFEQGTEFGVLAARGSVMGMVGVVIFCIAYSRCAMRFSWPLAACISLAWYFLSLEGLSRLPLGIGGSALLTISLLTVALCLNGRQPLGAIPAGAPWWDIPLRMVAATALLLGLTGAAAVIGPQYSGLLSVFPVFTSVMTVFNHKQYGPQAARKFVQGIMFGLYAPTGFFVILACFMEDLGLAWVYLAASIFCALLSFLTLKVIARFQFT